MKRHILVPLLCAVLPITSMAQVEQPDSVQNKELREVTIQASKVIRKADMDVYHPSMSAVENSKNGMQLLHNLMIPSVMVNEALGNIQAAGQSVQVRINGRVATIDQVKALLPGTIKRVEWMDNPGLRYNGATHVMNIVVVNPTVGGSLMADARPALNQAWGNYMASAKFNHGRSQWEANAYFKLTEKIDAHRDYKESFVFPDGTNLTRTETPVGGHLSNTMGIASLAYNYIKPDTTVFYAIVRAGREFSHENRYDGLLSLSDGSDDINLTDIQGQKGTTPSFNAYLEQHFAHRQMLVVDFGASAYLGRSYSDYTERLPGATDVLNNVHTYVKDRNQAYALEANYIKNWNSARFTAGASYTANRNRSTYENLDGQVFHQRQDKTYFFAEYFQRLNKFSFTAGIGAQYTDFLFRETKQGNHSWNVRPQASLVYKVNGDHQLKLNFTSWQSAPSLTESNIAPQQLDGFQWRIGNPDLKTSNSYMLTFNYNFGFFRRIYGTFGIRAFTSPDTITPLLYWNDGKLVTSYENSRGIQSLAFYLSPQITVIPKWLVASAHIQYRMERMRGTGYSLTNNAWSGNVMMQLMHWGFTFTGQYQRAARDLWGEKISWGEDATVIHLGYNYKKWQFGAGMLMPFGKYDMGSKSLSKWNTNEQHTRIDMQRMLFLSITCNLQWGRQKGGTNKLVNADAQVNQSTVGGR